ncbi:hypothetical protein [Pseudokordiimonas caeni]|uniref:hypothetical protein n=1 Tax=Pseudokordiimonas caeni TaxID=2997908 RepID=UPI0028123C4C|nr:hypothetical protein [Pseudokordiimonas caeni]
MPVSENKPDRAGWIMSAALHVGVVGVVIYGLPSIERPNIAPPPPIVIEFDQIAEKTQQLAPAPEEKAEEETKPEEEPKFAPAPEPEPEQAESVPLPEPKPAEPEKKEEKPEPPKPKPEEIERKQVVENVRPQAKPKPPSRFSASRISALIDKSIKEDQKPETDKKDEEKAPEQAVKKDTFAALRGRFATASLKDALSQKLAGCWNFPGGAKDVSNFNVTVRIWLRPDGSLSRMPQYADVGDLSDGFYRTFAESALRAVRLCEPFTEASDYIREGNQYIDFNFNGAEFAGG